MVRRSTPQATIDDRCYPVRMLILVPEEGFGALLGVGPGSFRHWLDQDQRPEVIDLTTVLIFHRPT